MNMVISYGKIQSINSDASGCKQKIFFNCVSDVFRAPPHIIQQMFSFARSCKEPWATCLTKSCWPFTKYLELSLYAGNRTDVRFPRQLRIKMYSKDFLIISVRPVIVYGDSGESSSTMLAMLMQKIHVDTEIECIYYYTIRYFILHGFNFNCMLQSLQVQSKSVCL